jgi:hypothetical protein
LVWEQVSQQISIAQFFGDVGAFPLAGGSPFKGKYRIRLLFVSPLIRRHLRESTQRVDQPYLLDRARA